MLIAKIQLSPHKVAFWEVVRVDKVAFDSRPGWVFDCRAQDQDSSTLNGTTPTTRRLCGLGILDLEDK